MAGAIMDKLEELGVGSWTAVNSRVVRGVDWAGGNADGHQGGTGEGVVTKVDGKNGVVSVRWDNGNYGYYRMGAGGRFELKMAPPPPYKHKEIRRKSQEEAEIVSEEEWESETESESEQEEEKHVEEPIPNPPKVATPPPVIAGKVCEFCRNPWTENCLSDTMCVECTGKLWRGEIVNKKNEFEKYDKIAFIRT